MIPFETIISEIKSETITKSYCIKIKVFGLTIYKRSYNSKLIDIETSGNAIGFNAMPDLKQYVEDETEL